MSKFTEIIMARSALREHRSVLIALDTPLVSLAPLNLSLGLLTFSHCLFPLLRLSILPNLD